MESSRVTIDPRLLDTFLTRFEGNVRARLGIEHPVTGDVYRIDPGLLVQKFNRRFGRVVQLQLSIRRLLKKHRLVLAAVALEPGGLEEMDGRTRPVPDLLRQIAEPDGLDFQDDAFFVVGVLSPVDWSADWRPHAAIGGSAAYYLVNHVRNTQWRVVGSDKPEEMKSLFDPESLDEKAARARGVLDGHPGLVLAGDHVDVRELASEHGLDRATLDEVVKASNGRWQIIEHKGRAIVQRSAGV